MHPSVPKFGFVDLDKLHGRYRSPGSGLGKIGVNYLPPMNAMQPVPYGARVLTLADVRKFTGGDTAIPTNFDWAAQNASITSPGNQGQCGCCYAYSSASALADRWAIATKSMVPKLSVLQSCSCIPTDTDGNATTCCEGGNPYFVGKYYETNGITLDECFPFEKSDAKTGTSPDCGTMGDPNSCPGKPEIVKDGKRPTWLAIPGSTAYLTDVSKAADAGIIAKNIQVIKAEVLAHGPVVSCFWVYDDFEDPKSASWVNGIYKYNGKGAKLGAHAVVITGWGPDFWIIRNSWGPEWNPTAKGYFRAYDGLHGNEGVGFDHCAQLQGGGANDIIGGAFTWLADPNSGTPASARQKPSSGTSQALKIIGYIVVGLLFIFVVYGIYKAMNG
jgi:hypothetical protein